MFLSDTLEAIYDDSKQFDIDTCIKIIHAVRDKCIEELTALHNIAKEKGSINSNTVYSAIKRQETTFKQFCKKHPEIPQDLIDKVGKNIENYNSLIGEVVSNSNHRENNNIK